MRNHLQGFVCMMGLLAAAVSPISAQAPTGTISGTVTDTSGGVIPNAKVVVTNRDTGIVTTLATGGAGIYAAPALPAGTYSITAEVPGFAQHTRVVTVQVGTTATVDFQLRIGKSEQSVIVEGVGVEVDTEEHAIDGVVTRQKIESLPLNGRSFLNLASIEPGVMVSAGNTSQYNALFSVAILGGSSDNTAVSVDGGAIRNTLDGGVAMNFSQEVVQEFQVSSANFDVSTDITAVGSVNVVTRTGGNQFHGSGYFYFRDHNMAAYPGLSRNAADPNPFFVRRNPGFWLGGPIKKDKLFFFFNYEYMNQVQAATVQPDLPSLAPLAGNFGSPYVGKNISARFDYKASDKNNMFLRYSHDGNNSFGSAGGTPSVSYWLNNVNWSDQGLFGVTSSLRPTLINDFRFNYQFWSNRNLFPTASECPNCIGLGYPGLEFVGSSEGSFVGDTSNATQGRDTRRFTFSDSLTWQKGKHRIVVGGLYEHLPGSGFWGFCDPGCEAVFSPEYIKSQLGALTSVFYPTLPSVINSNAALQNLPFLAGGGTVVGIGNPSQPPPYNFDKANYNDRMRVYAQDTWRFRHNLTFSYGLAWEYENNLFNEDLPKPAILAPLYGSNLAPTTISKHNFSPSLGFAWSPNNDNKWVVRGGAGMYWDTVLLYYRLQERSEIGPLGSGRIEYPTTGFTNIFTGIVNVGATAANYLKTGSLSPVLIPVGAALPASALTTLTLGQFMQIYSTELPSIQASLAGTSSSLTVTPMDVAKSAAELMPANFPTPRSYHMSLGFQHQLRSDAIVSLDFVRRIAINQLWDGSAIDLNHFNKIVNGQPSPVIPACTAAQQASGAASTPGVNCSNGAITFWEPGARNTYQAMLVKVDKRFAHRFQFTASYALQSQYGVNGIYDLTNWAASWGPQGSRNILNIVGVLDLPWGFQLGLVSSLATRPPVTATVSGVELNDSGATLGAAIPGIGYNCLNAGCSASQLTSAVANWNSTYAGKTDATGEHTFPALTLPSNYELGEGSQSQDLRLTKMFTYKERYKASAFVEMFNVFNVSNLSGYNFNLNSGTFGQPTQRTTQVFGSGGPRAVQIGARISF